MIFHCSGKCLYNFHFLPQADWEFLTVRECWLLLTASSPEASEEEDRVFNCGIIRVLMCWPWGPAWNPLFRLQVCMPRGCVFLPSAASFNENVIWWLWQWLVQWLACVEFVSLFFYGDLFLLVVIDSRNWIRLLPRNPKFLGPDARWTCNPLGSDVCSGHVVPQKVPTKGLSEWQVSVCYSFVFTAECRTQCQENRRQCSLTCDELIRYLFNVQSLFCQTVNWRKREF